MINTLGNNVLFFIFGHDGDMYNNVRWNGNSVRHSIKGFSGTHQSIIATAELLVNLGFNVFISSSDCIPNTIVNNVKYVTYNGCNAIIDKIDTIIIPGWLYPPHQVKLDHIKNLIIWCHTKVFPPEEEIKLFKRKYPHCKIHINTITTFTHRVLDSHFEYYKKYADKVVQIRNPLVLDMIQPVLHKKPHSFIFPASFDRGGTLACNVFDRLNFEDKGLTICSYVGSDIGINLKDTYEVGTLGKLDLFRTLSKTEYFLYPGISSVTSRIIKETDSCIVAECLLHEVIVFAFPVGGLYENYKDNVVWIPIPKGYEYMQNTEDSHVPDIINENLLKTIEDLIYQIDSDPIRKMELRKKGREFVRIQRDAKTISKQLEDLIKN
jgi:glycosyltransferase involved in cell wall biosynthesis